MLRVSIWFLQFAQALDKAAQGVESPSLEVFKKLVDVHFRIWFNRHGGVGWMVGLDDLRGLFQPMIL